MDNRHLSVRAVSRATRRAESTVNQLLSGRIQPNLEILQDLAPSLRMPIEDLSAIADIPVASPEDPTAEYPPTSEIGQLTAIASRLPLEQRRQLLDFAMRMQAENY
jgi:transcriptional regulator with XRE-family HTH domain